MPLPTRELGKTGVKIPTIGLGCMGMSDFYGQSEEKENIDVLNKSIELGSYLWDTSDMYGIGANEILVSKVLKERRNDVFLCTKFGVFRNPDAPGAENMIIKVDYIDLYYQHRVDPNTPIEETVAAMAELVKEGKVKYIGLSECSAKTLRRAHKVHPIAALQLPFFIRSSIVHGHLILKKNGINSPLGRGFLTGKYQSIDDLDQNDSRRTNPRFSGDNFQKNLEMVKKFQEFASKKGVATSQLCLAWVLAQGENIVAIPGTKNIKYLEENVGAVNVQLSPEELSEIRQIIDSIEIVGNRYKPMFAAVTY
ncbi:3778_t:CDS:2 [Funneliformis geosporum]|nr:3778_t:CDS:2 [Funneliformis geosporum]